MSLRPGGQMKFGIIVGAVSGLALCASAATAQVCQGDLSFRSSRTHLGAALAMSSNTTSFGGAGFQLTPSLVLRPSITLLAAASPGTDNTIFGVSATIALPH